MDHLDQADGAAKLVVMEAATKRGGLAKLKLGDLTYNTQATSSAYTARVDISESGRITIVTEDAGASSDPAFLLTPLDEPGGQKSGASLIWPAMSLPAARNGFLPTAAGLRRYPPQPSQRLKPSLGPSAPA